MIRVARIWESPPLHGKPRTVEPAQHRRIENASVSSVRSHPEYRHVEIQNVCRKPPALRWRPFPASNPPDTTVSTAPSIMHKAHPGARRNA